MSKLKCANDFMRSGFYIEALHSYEALLDSEEWIGQYIKLNMELCKKRIIHKRRDSNYSTLYDFGVNFIGPIISAYFYKLITHIKEQNSVENYRFLAREGYLLQKIFSRLKKEYDLQVGTVSYLHCSRAFLFKLTISDFSNIKDTLKHHFHGNIIGLLKNRYVFTNEEINEIIKSSPGNEYRLERVIQLPNELDVVTHELSYFREKIEEICTLKKELYLEYLDEIGFGLNGNENLIDIGYAGTIQKQLTKLTNKKTIGHYFITTKDAQNTDLMQFIGHLVSNTAFGCGLPLLDRSLFIEAIFTAPHGQVVDIAYDGSKYTFHYGKKTVAQYKFNDIECIIDGATDYVLTAIPDNIMDIDELNTYYKSFVNNLSLIPNDVSCLLEIDDSISGLGTLNPISFFTKV